MAFDEAHKVAVLFGGSDGNARLGDTWIWNGSKRQWTQAKPPKSPTARQGHRMAYDTDNKRIVLYGGLDATGELSDCWAWDGRTWIELSANGGVPPRRRDAVLVYDEQQGKLVLFGGRGDRVFADTWELTVQ